MKTYRAQVFGTVQGVWFRYHTARMAEKSGLCGRATNLADGSVEVLLQGEQEAVQRLLAWLAHGPRTACVERIEVEEYETVESFNGFRAY